MQRKTQKEAYRITLVYVRCIADTGDTETRRRRFTTTVEIDESAPFTDVLDIAEDRLADAEPGVEFEVLSDSVIGCEVAR